MKPVNSSSVFVLQCAERRRMVQVLPTRQLPALEAGRMIVRYK